MYENLHLNFKHVISYEKSLIFITRLIVGFLLYDVNIGILTGIFPNQYKSFVLRVLSWVKISHSYFCAFNYVSHHYLCF